MAAHPSRVTDLFAALLPSFTGEARTVIVRAQEEARGRRHGYVGTEHLLLAVVADAPVAEGMAALGIDADTIAADVEAAVPPGDVALVGHIPFTPRAKHIIAEAGRSPTATGSSPAMSCGRSCAAPTASPPPCSASGPAWSEQELVAEIDQRMSAQDRPMSPPDKAELHARMDLLAEQLDQLRRDLG